MQLQRLMLYRLTLGLLEKYYMKNLYLIWKIIDLLIPNTKEAYKNIQKLTKENGQKAFKEFFKALYERNTFKSI